MRGLGYVFQVLAKGIGTKAAIAVTVTAVTVTSGAVGYGGYQVVTHIQQIKQERQLQEEQLQEEQQIQAEEPVVHPPKQVSEVDPSLNLPQTLNTDLIQENNTSDSQDHETDENTDALNPNNENPKSNELKNKELKVNQRKERLEKLAAANAKAVPKNPIAAVSPVNQLTLQQLYLNALQQVVSGTQTQQTSGNTNSGETTTNQEQTPSIVPTVNPTPIPDPAPNPPSWSPINQQAKKITPAVLYGDNPSIDGTSYITSETQPLDEKKYTVMIYLCGTDLETPGGGATDDILNMLCASYDMSEVNVILCAGGTTGWQNDYMNANSIDDSDQCNNDGARFNIYQLNPSAIDNDLKKYKSRSQMPGENKDSLVNQMINSQTLQLLGSYDPIDMSQDQLVAGALNLCSTYYPAENYGAVFWDHGGGINSGVCSSASVENVEGTMITSAELESAFASSDLYQSGNKMSFIGYDACLMGSVELAYSLSPYCKYMLGSSEVTGGGWDYSYIFNEISEKSKEADTNKTPVDNEEICRKMVDSYRSNHHGDAETIASLACFDSEKMLDAAKAINESAVDLLAMYQSVENNSEQQAKWYQVIKRARIHSFTTGGGVYSTERNINSDYVDLRDYYRQLKTGFTNILDDYKDEPEMYQSIMKICDSLEKVLKQDFIVASAVNYNGASILNRPYGVIGEEEYPVFWRDIRGGDLLAATLFMPYYQLKDSNPESTPVKTYSAMNILTDYNRFTDLYNEIAQMDQDRIKRLAAVIQYKDTIDQQELTKNTITERDLTSGQDKQYDVLQLTFKNQYEEEKSGDYIDPYTDFMDTINKTTVYISRYQETDSEEHTGINLVYGEKDVTYSNISNDNESIDIFTNVLSNVYGYKVYGQKYNSTEVIQDWARLADAYFNTEENLKKLGEEVYDKNSSKKWISLKGQIGKKQEQDETINYNESAIHFYQSQDSNNSEVYILGGVTYWGKNEEDEDAWITKDYNSLNGDFTALQFWHYIVKDGKEEIQTAFNDPVMIFEDRLAVYITDLMDDKKYNDYTIGFTGQTVKDNEGHEITQQYILPSGACKEDEYGNYTDWIGNVVQSVSGQEVSAESNEEPSMVTQAVKVQSGTADSEIVPNPEISGDEEETEIPEEIPADEQPAIEPTPEVTEIATPTETDTQPVIEATPIPQPAAEQIPEVTTTTTETPQPTTESEPVSDETTPTPEPTAIEAIPVNETPEIEIEIATQPAA